MKIDIPEYFDARKFLEERIVDKGGWVNAHAHFDRAFTITRDNFEFGKVFFQEKWAMNSKIDAKSSVEKIYDRMAAATERMLDQGASAVGSFIDVDHVVKDRSIKAAMKIRERYGRDITFRFINQTLHGVLEKDAYKWFKVAVEFVDIIGGLPSKDKGKEGEHLDVLLSTAKSVGKMVHVHVDQLHDKDEKETELLIEKVKEHEMQGKVVGVHCVSVAAKEKSYREFIYKGLRDNDISVICNPVAYIDDPRKEVLVPSHNSVFPVDEAVPFGVNVALGADNIADLHKPFTNGSMWEELLMIIEACRFHDLDALVDIATVNGRKVLGLE